MAKRKRSGGLGFTSDVHRDRAGMNKRTAESAAKNGEYDLRAKQCAGALGDLISAAYFAGRAEESEFSTGTSRLGGSSGKVYEKTVGRLRPKVIAACLRTRPAATKR